MSNPGGYFKTLTLARAQEIQEIRLRNAREKIAKSYRDRMGETFTARS